MPHRHVTNQHALHAHHHNRRHGQQLAPPSNTFPFTVFPGYRVDLLAGGQAIASDNNSLLASEGTFLTSQFSISIGASHVLADQSLGIRSVNLNAGPASK
jgi:hypothetical protein